MNTTVTALLSSIGYILLISFALMYALWGYYLAVMALYRAYKEEPPTIIKVLGFPIIFIGLFLDFFVNVTILSVILCELPQELLVTKRLTRHINRTAEGTYRHKVCLWLCTNLLNPFDPSGCHCKKDKP